MTREPPNITGQAFDRYGREYVQRYADLAPKIVAARGCRRLVAVDGRPLPRGSISILPALRLEGRGVSRRVCRVGDPSVVLIVEGVFATSPFLEGRHAV